jgi:cytochrome c556
MRRLTIRTLIIAALIALLAGAAYAQGGGGRRQTSAKSEQKTEDLAKKSADEKAYKDALEKIPESKEKPDPWKSMR